MTLNITIASPRYIICATDRRLVDINTRKIITEQATKMTLLNCADAVACIAYNGIGRYRNKTPADWILDLDAKASIASLPFTEVLNLLRAETEKRINEIPKNYDRRHTFVIGAGGHGKTSIHVISNYEEAQCENQELVAKDNFFITESPPEVGKTKIYILVTGANDQFEREDGSKIEKAARKPGARGIDIKNLCVKAIRNAAHRSQNVGVIGTSVLWAIIEGFHKDAECGLDVPGGTTIGAMPNMIKPQIQMKDIKIEMTNGEPIMWGKPFPLPEYRCIKCNNPVPLGYKKCSVCGSNIPS